MAPNVQNAVLIYDALLRGDPCVLFEHFPWLRNQIAGGYLAPARPSIAAPVVEVRRDDQADLNDALDIGFGSLEY